LCTWISPTRLYAEYFGGGLDIKSMEGFGTDAYLHLNRLGSECENLPRGVMSSPSMKDSTRSLIDPSKWYGR
jgi:hypothetical protein